MPLIAQVVTRHSNIVLKATTALCLVTWWPSTPLPANWYTRDSQPSLRDDEARRLLCIERVGQMWRQNQVAVQTDIVADVADDKNLRAWDSADWEPVVRIAEDLRLISTSQARELDHGAALSTEMRDLYLPRRS